MFCLDYFAITLTVQTNWVAEYSMLQVNVNGLKCSRNVLIKYYNLIVS